MLLRKDQFQWTTEAKVVFNSLKQAMTSVPVLTLPDFLKEFIVECDAFGVGLGVVLMQEGHSIAFASHTLSFKALTCQCMRKN